MRCKAIFLALLALVFEAQARSVAPEEAARAARVWAKTGLDRAPGECAAAKARQTAAGTAFYSVAMDGGTLFLSGDTRRRPVIAFVSAGDVEEAIEPNSPLWALLSRDQDAQVVAEAAKAAAGATGGAAASVSAAEREWADLLADEEPSNVVAPAKAIAPATTHVSTLSDVRVKPLVQSKWGQSKAKGKACFNACTPMLSDGQRAVCGCVATAMSQVMRYHRHPATEVKSLERTCYIEPSTKSKDKATVTLTMQGGVYDWANMPLDPSAGVNDAQCQAIGKLTSDAGISVCMSYDVDGSGAFLFNVAKALKETFGYAAACYYRAAEVSKQTQVMRDAFLSNLDAGYPVLMGISGSKGGHAIVGDGYGYGNSKLYVHLNMGWNGQDNVWYNLPDIDSSPSFTVFDDLVYDIFPTAGGVATLSGRVVDDEGKGLKDTLVEIYPSGADVPVATGRTTNGVFGVRVAAGNYDIVAYSADGTMTESQQASVKGPTESTGSYSGWINKDRGWSEKYANIKTATAVGNLQKTAPIVIFKPTVRIGESQFASLSKALAAAKAFAAENPGEVIDVEVLADTELSESFVVDFACTMFASEPGKAVTRVKNARFDVVAGGNLAVSGLAFAGSSAKLFVVAADGFLTVGAGVAFGVPETTAAVETARADGFTVTGLPDEPFMVDCTSARGVEEVFGFADCNRETAQALAAKFVNLNDPNGELSGKVTGGAAPYALAWSLEDVPLEDAAAYYVMDGKPETTNCFRRLDRLFEIFESETGPARVTVVKGGKLTRKVTLKDDLEIVAEGVTVSNVAATAGFVIGEGTKLTVNGLSFDGSWADALFLVNGGELQLCGDMAIRNVNGANPDYSGAVAVKKGLVSIGSDEGAILFENCRNDHQNALGGAVYLGGEDCELMLRGRVSMTNCSARRGGGGIYMESDSKVSLSGFLTICDNTSTSNNRADDICYWRSTADVSTLRLAGLLETGSRVGVLIKGGSASSLNKPGKSFLTVDGAFTDKSRILESSAAFFFDGKPELSAEPDDAYRTLRWFADDGSVKPVDPEAAKARVVLSDGSEGWYGSLEDAFKVVTGDATIELLSDAAMESDVTVSGSVVLRSGAGGPFAVTRAAQCQFTVAEGAALTIEDLTVDGRLDDERGGNGLLVEVVSGELTLGAGAVLCDVSGGDERASGAVKVYKGKVTMLEGSEIRECVNSYVDLSSNNSRGGGITADSVSVVRLLGGTIDGCVANRGGAAFVGNGSTVEIGGDFTAIENADDPMAPNNVCVAATSELILVSELTGKVGVLPGVNADPYVFGTVASTFTGDAAIANSAHNFRHDKTDDIGIAVRNGRETLLVWSDGLDANGNFVKDGKTYKPVKGGDVIEVPVPEAFENLVYDATEQVGVNDGHGFVIVGDTAVDAGDYTATLTLKPGFKWKNDGTTTEKEIGWSIAPAPLTVTAVACGKVQGEADPPLTYSVAGLQGKDLEGDVLSGELVRTEGEDPGTYAILRGTLEVVNPNYTLTFVGADFTISTPPPPPGPDPVPCVPFAFTAILNPAEGSWQLTINPAVKYCKYTVLASDDLKTWTPVIVDEEATADGEKVFTLPATGPQKFWQAIGKDGEKPAAGN